jgi:hypothetical protein
MNHWSRSFSFTFTLPLQVSAIILIVEMKKQRLWRVSGMLAPGTTARKDRASVWTPEQCDFQTTLPFKIKVTSCQAVWLKTPEFFQLMQKLPEKVMIFRQLQELGPRGISPTTQCVWVQIHWVWCGEVTRSNLTQSLAGFSAWFPRMLFYLISEPLELCSTNSCERYRKIQMDDRLTGRW